MKHLIIFMLFCITVSCNTPDATLKDTSTETEGTVKKDTSAMEVAALPIHFDSTDYLIYAVGEFQLSDERGLSKLYSGSSSSGTDLGVIYKSGYHVSGNMLNLYFQPIDSESRTSLTDQYLRIRSFTFLRSVFDATKKEILLYSVSDQDSNGDEQITHKDIEALFFSNIDGSGFEKLTPDHHELIDWTMVEIQNRLYFRTMEDLDKNNELDEQDKIHYFFVDFDDEKFSAVEYEISG